MNLPKANPAGRFILTLATPLAAVLVLTGCVASDAPDAGISAAGPTVSTAGEFPAFVQTATDRSPATTRALKPAAPDTTAQGDEVPVHGPGLYRLALGTGTGPEEGKDQFLICMFHESPGDVAICKANIPVRWKELDGQHRQASRVIISQDSDGLLEVRADNEKMMTTRILPTDITDEAVISGLHISVDNNEAHFSADPEEIAGSVLVTPDSYEIITEPPAGTATGAATVRRT